MGENVSQINQYLDYLFAYGPFWVYLVIFVACFVENLFPPFPGDSFIAAAGGLIAVSRLDFLMTFLLVIVGGTSSVMLLYFFGKNYGRDYFIRKDFKYFSADDIIKMEEKFSKWGVLILIFSRFVVGLRAVLAIVAGIGRYRALKMLIFSVVSYILFTSLVMYIAIRLVENFERIEYLFRTYSSVVWPLMVLLVVLYFARKFVTVRKQS
ncbi:MAG: DedA family protein [candidate division Zixibacteria bacterium]|nr:DedA family protein [candidate division Zixibacteria bacterium]